MDQLYCDLLYLLDGCSLSTYCDLSSAPFEAVSISNLETRLNPLKQTTQLSRPLYVEIGLVMEDANRKQVDKVLKICFKISFFIPHITNAPLYDSKLFGYSSSVAFLN